MYPVMFFRSGQSEQALALTAISISQWLESFRIKGENPRDVSITHSHSPDGDVLISVSCRLTG